LNESGPQNKPDLAQSSALDDTGAATFIKKLKSLNDDVNNYFSKDEESAVPKKLPTDNES
jgi:hypothetical protein